MKKFYSFILLVQVKIFTTFAVNDLINYAICTNSSNLIFVCEETQINVENSNISSKRVERAVPSEGADSPIPTFESFKVGNPVIENAQLVDNNEAIESSGHNTNEKLSPQPLSSSYERIKRSPDGENTDENQVQSVAITEPTTTVEQSTEAPQTRTNLPETQHEHVGDGSPSENKKEIPNENTQNLEKRTDTPKETPISDGHENTISPTVAAQPAAATPPNSNTAEETPVSNVEQKSENSAIELKTGNIEAKIGSDSNREPTTEAKSTEKTTDNRSTVTDDSNLKCFFGDARITETYPKNNFVSISYDKCHFSRLPTSLNMFSEYSNLKILNISYIDLEIFDKIKGAINLEVILASFNNLTEVSSGLFSNSNSLITIDFSHNRISRIDPLAFADLAHLKFLNISWNSLTTVDPTLFTKLVNLEYLDVSHNQISVLDSQLLSHLLNLSELKLSSNLIDKINASSFTLLKRLQHLDISNLKLTDIEPGTFSNQIELKSLNLTNNNFKRINFELFSSLINLMSINLNGNQLTNLDDFKIDSFPKLEIFAINNNQFNCSYLETFLKTFTLKNIDFINGQSTQNGDSINGVSCKNSSGSMEKYIEVKLHNIVCNVEDNVSTMKLSLAFLCIAMFALIIFIVAIRRKVNKATGRSAIYELSEDVDGKKEGKAVICT